MASEASSSIPPNAAAADRIPSTAFVLLALMTIFWGINFPVMKVALREIEPWTFRMICLTSGAIGLFAIARIGGHRLSVPRADAPMLVVLALLNITAWHLFSAFGISLMAAGKASILAYTMPLWAVLFAAMFLGERLSATRIAGLVMGLGAMALLIGDEWNRVSAAPAGALCMIGAAVSWGLGTAVLKGRRWGMTATVLTGWQMVIGGLPVLAGFAWLGHPPPVSQVTAPAWMALAYAATVPMVFCHYAWTRLVALVPAGVAAISTLLIPVVGVLSSAPLAGEAVGAREVLALGLVVGALVAVLVLPGRRAR